MITGLLMRHYKNYGNVRFVPIMNDTNHMFTVYIGNNGVGKSAILEALDLVFTDTTWSEYGGGEGAEYLGTMIISGGLAGEHGVPRVNNPMEVSVVELE